MFSFVKRSWLYKSNIKKIKFLFFSITTKYIQQLITKLLKIKLTKQDNTGQNYFLTIKTITTTTKNNKKVNEMKLLAPASLPFHFELSINQSFDQ